MDFKNNIPAWSYSKIKKKSQFMGEESVERPRTVRYRGVMVYEVEIPAQPDNPQAEQTAADKAADELYQKIWSVVGDKVPIQDPPERYA